MASQKMIKNIQPSGHSFSSFSSVLPIDTPIDTIPEARISLILFVKKISHCTAYMFLLMIHQKVYKNVKCLKNVIELCFIF